jgi:hypothetical protein
MSIENKTKILVCGLAFSTCLGLVGCGINDRLNDMHDKTNAMADNLDTSTKNTVGMSKKMDATLLRTAELEEISSKMHSGMRSEMLSNGREEQWKELFKAKDIGQKLAHAGSFFYQYEFQGFTGFLSDDHRMQENMKAQAAEDFMKRVEFLLGNTSNIPETRIANSQRNLTRMALAASMSRVFPEQEYDAGQRGFEVVSVYSMIVQALESLKKHPYESTKDLMAEHEFLVILRMKEPTLVNMMQTRLNFIPLYVYGEIAGLGHESLLDAVAQTFSLIHSNVVGYAPEISLYDKNLTQIEKYNYYLKAALRTRRVLIEYGAGASLDTSSDSLFIGDVFKRVNFDGFSTKRFDFRFSQLRPAIRDFNYLAKLLVAPWQEFMKVDAESYKDDPKFLEQTDLITR